MGCIHSDHVPDLHYLGNYCTITLKRPNIIRLIQCRDEVALLLKNVVQEIYPKENVKLISKQNFQEVALPFKFNLPHEKKSRSEGNLIQIVFVQLLEKLLTKGYDVAASFSLGLNELGSMIFERDESAGENFSEQVEVCCLAPSEDDKLLAFKCPQEVLDEIRTFLWFHADTQFFNEHLNESIPDNAVKEFQIMGMNWKDQAIYNSILILNITERLAKLNWHYLASLDLGNGSNSMFWVKSQSVNNRSENPRALQTRLLRNYATMSYWRKDKIKLNGFSTETTGLLKQKIAKFCHDQEPEERIVLGMKEFTIKEPLFHACEENMNESRRLTCKLLNILSKGGWKCLNSFDIGKSVRNKSVFLFQETSSENLNWKHSCISLHANNIIRLINFPSKATRKLQDVIRNNYSPGIESEEVKYDQCYQFNLKFSPWNSDSKFNPHGKSIINFLINEVENMGWKFEVSATVASTKISQRDLKRGNTKHNGLEMSSFFFSYNPERVDLEEDNLILAPLQHFFRKS